MWLVICKQEVVDGETPYFGDTSRDGHCYSFLWWLG